jgi:hypothetical protein
MMIDPVVPIVDLIPMSSAQNRLDDLVTQFEEILQTIQRDLQRVGTESGPALQALVADIERRLSDVDTRLLRMASDIRSLPPDTREYYEGEINTLRGLYTEYSATLTTKKATAASPAARLTSQAASNTARSQGVTEKLDEAIMTGNNTITTGNVIMTTLLDDRRSLEQIEDNLRATDSQAQAGLERAKKMLRRACCNKFLAWVIVVLLMGLLAVEIWAKWNHKI